MTARVSAPNDEATLRSSKERKARTPSQVSFVKCREAWNS
jgi:hypothetical protein